MPERRLFDLPPRFLERMAAFLGDEYREFAAHLAQSARLGLRVNTLKLDPAHLFELLGLTLEPLPWCPEGFPLPPYVHLGRHPFNAAGLFYLQEPSAMAAVPLLDPQPGERILDLCGAPGGKATHIAARMQSQGLLWANEIHVSRARILMGNLERWGVRNAVVSAEPPDRLAGYLPGFFDRVLVDAPCSGEGLFRRDPNAAREWSPAAVQGCARRQARILEDAARLVRPGGILVYATCTFAPEENEGVIGRFLAGHPDYALEDAPPLFGSDPGRPDWVHDLPQSVATQLSRTQRFWPHRALGEGHFLARLRRQEGAPPRPLPHWQPPQPLIADRQLVQRFLKDYLPGVNLPSALTLLGEGLYAPPQDMPDPGSLRLMRPGWSLGLLRRRHFIPSHALAIAAPGTAAAERLDLDPEDTAITAYLRGETLTRKGPEGWLLVTVSGFPMGWGKRVGRTVKNHLPKRMRQP
jgi:NOL1/NOP2/sun family putative RNA methylase